MPPTILSGFQGAMGAITFGRGTPRTLRLVIRRPIRARQPSKGCIHHSDRGSQYACEAYRELLARASIERLIAWARRLDGPARQSLRQCQGRKLYEDAEGERPGENRNEPAGQNRD